jgi:plastocyanin
MTKIGLLLSVFLLMGAIATGCSSTKAPSGSTEGTTAVAGPTITISGMSFGDPITVSPGATVAIENKDPAEHSVTSDPKGAFDTQVDGKTQKTFTAPTKPGEYAFICVYHPSMKGTLIVK